MNVTLERVGCFRGSRPLGDVVGIPFELMHEYAGPGTSNLIVVAAFGDPAGGGD